MAKIADSYFKADPWKIIEEGFNADHSTVAESVFSLGNEYMGVRGYFEEGYSGDTLQGSYFNGVYEKKKANAPGYKGIVQETEFMVNSLDWLYTGIEAAGEKLDLSKVDFSDFRRELDLKTGLLKRCFIWHTKSGDVRICFERVISMTENEQASSLLTIKSIDFNGTFNVKSGLDFDTVHGGDKKLWNCFEHRAEENLCHIKGKTVATGMAVESFCAFRGSLVNKASESTGVKEDKKVYINYTLNLEKGEEVKLEKNVINLSPLSDLTAPLALGELENMSFAGVYSKSGQWWDETWKRSDIEIIGDLENQQGIRFCIFQMFQTYHGAVKGTNIGAKGLTGEAYNGNAFWDTETYCLPFYLFADKNAARNLLYFRYATLEEAKNRAKALDCKGAFYPIATISGRECCDLWQHASLQLQASTAVAYGIWLYEKITGDTEFLEEYGLEMLIEISRMLATRGDYNPDRTEYGYYCVMGPDEFQMMVNNNCYTNYMGKFTLEYTLHVMEKMAKENPEKLKCVKSTVSFDESETLDWREKAEKMLILFDEKTKLFEQHKGFFDLPSLDVDSIPVEDFPLYSHWSYDRIYRNNMIKQPDVLMFLLLFNSSFSQDVIRANYEYYEPKCIHESSLSPSVHSIFAEQLGKYDEAMDFFKFATRMDLDNYNRNSGEGLHTTSIAAAWMNIVYGFGGFRSDGEVLCFAPKKPSAWDGYDFRIVYEGAVINVEVRGSEVTIKTLGGENLRVKVYGAETEIGGKETVFKIPA
ncbi:MAG: family 65 glycosyl hydrolase [Acetatifactor sp.]|nr:family 65 glycosyl hydrolase [Acetatifactor sp.]